ncbi:VOC family protein [Nocardia vermiculata]|uniref:VOC family protein n=1 Tax=Nocardia vermiculata TaxID=257274 RepID=A0A846XY58_9NOCA|nr:VOC family protein [Nocardia vermiculata]NKY52033.1 VOC family protein [Nocardia vermiculata]
MTLRIEMVTIDCEDPRRLAEFWAPALELDVLADYGGEFVLLGRPGESPNVGLQKVPEPRVGKNRVHFDLHGEPRAAAAERMVGLGAKILTEHTMPGLAWIVLADPEGNEFCIGEHTD